MCFKAYTEQARTKHTADKDIRVYKICTLEDNQLYSRIKRFKYELLKVNAKIDIKFKQHYGLYYVSEGYHSYVTCRWYPKVLTYYKVLGVIIGDNDLTLGKASFQDLVIAEFIIPKNTTYYKNNNGEIVSEQIIFTGIVHKPIIYKDGNVESAKINLNEKDRILSNKII